MNYSQKYKFKNWNHDKKNKHIPSVAAGVYGIWDKDKLLYCGMSGRDIENAKLKNKNNYGLITRLKSHSTGKLGGDQFCVYIANKIIVPSLKIEDLYKFETGEFTLDTLTKQYIDELEYQFIIVDTSQQAYDEEVKARNGTIFSVKPLLNPIQ